MLPDRTRGIRTLCLICQLTLVTVAYCLCVGLYSARLAWTVPVFAQYVAYLEFMLLGVLVSSTMRTNSDRFLTSSFVNALREALRQIAIGLLFLFIYLLGSRDRIISHFFLAAWVPVFCSVLACTNHYLPALIGKWLFSGARAERILLVGTSRDSELLRKWLANKEAVGFRIIGVLFPESDPDNKPIAPVLGRFDELERVIQKHQISQVILVGFPRFFHLLRICTQACEKLGVRLLVVNDFEWQFGHSITLFEDDGMRFIGLREEPLENPFNRGLKRVLDLAVAIPVTVLVLPFTTALVCVLQRLQSPGPVFHLQLRAGMRNRPFHIIKYRSMHVNQPNQSRQATPDDPRIFPAGRWLRRFSIDEFPQFYNVLRGEMSVVGPRPHLIEHNEIFAKALTNYHVRAAVKPGITGLAQVRGFRGGIYGSKDTADRVSADIHYLENWSFVLDCWIILKTIGQLFIPPKTAY